MDNKASGLVSGLGGAAMLALLLTPTGKYPSKSNGSDAAPAKQPSVASSSSSGSSTHVESGPWRAICREYETDFERHDVTPGKIKTGVTDHVEVRGADPAAKSYVIHTKIGNLPAEETYEVTSHPVGNPADCVDPDKNLDVLLATIPDPLESHFALDFDRDIEALEVAAKVSGEYSISGYWLPWDVGGAAESKADAKSAAEWVSRSNEPGVLVFHNGKGQRLFVFLVGETPTSGLQRVQFGNALLYMRDLSLVALGRSPVTVYPEPIRIAAPHFSASLLGIAEALKEARSKFLPEPQVRILSPNAGSYGLIKNFEDSLKAPQDLNTRFGTLALLYPDQKRAALTYLGELHYAIPDIAVVEEDESAFSVSINVSNSDSKDEPLTLYYPRDLSPLRKITDALIPSDTEINGVKLPLWSVPVTLGETIHVTQDSPPAFAAEQEAARIDHALQAIVFRLKEHKIRAAIIDASNNLDALLLLEYFRRELPNMRFVHLGAEEFEIGGSENADLTGTISVTGTLLSRDSLFEKKSFSDLALHFDSEDSEGTFMAAALLLNPQDKDFDPADLSKVKVSAITTLVGRSDFLPVPIDKEHSNPSFPLNPIGLNIVRGNEPGMPRAWRILMLAMLAAVIVHFVSLSRSKALSRSNAQSRLEERTPLTWAYPGYCNEYESDRMNSLIGLNNQYLLLEFAICATSLSAFWGSIRAFRVTNLRTSWAMGHGALWATGRGAFWDSLYSLPLMDGALLALNAGALIGCVVCTVQMITQCMKPELKSDPRKLWISLIYLVWTIAMWSAMLWNFVGFNAKGIASNAMRIMLTSEGLSPLIPFMAITIAYIVYCWTELNSVDWAARRAVNLTVESKFDVTLYETNLRLTNWLKPSPMPSTRIRKFGLVGALFFWAGLNLSHALSGFDGRWFRWWLTWLGFGLLLVTLTFMVYRAWKIWMPLRNMLRRLQETEMAAAFACLHEENLKLDMWDLGKREQDLTISAKTVKSLAPLLLPKELEVAKVALNAVQAAEARREKHSCKEYKELAKWLNAPMNDALPYLDGEPDPAAKARARAEDYRRYLVLRFFALVRYSLLNMRNLYTFVVYGFALLAVTIVTYPFEGRSNLTVALTIVFVFILATVGLMFVQIQKSWILRAIGGATDGHVSYFEIFKHLISIGGVPALIVIVTQFPSLAQMLISWAKPGLDLLR